MKKKVKKLSLNKETVRSLTDDELRGVAGADHTHGHCTNFTCPATCAETCGCPTQSPSCEGGCTFCCGDTSPCQISCVEICP